MSIQKNDDDCCSICLNKMVRNTIITHCGHKFHRNCLRSSIKKCPMCRSPLFHNHVNCQITRGIHYEGNFFLCEYQQPINQQITINDQQRQLRILNELERSSKVNHNEVNRREVNHNEVNRREVNRREESMINRISNYITRLFN